MCRPLKEIVTELECKYAGQELTYDLEERRRFIADFDKSLTYLIDYSKKYEEDVEYAIGHKMSPDVIGRLTINLIVLMIHLTKDLLIFSHLIIRYMMNDYYERNQQYSGEFKTIYTNIKSLISRLRIFDAFKSKDKIDEDDISRKMYDESKKWKIDTFEMPQPNEKEMEKMNGAEILVCLEYSLFFFYSNIVNFNNIYFLRHFDDCEKCYELNYLLYAKKYWRAEEQYFRSHILNHRLKGKVSIYRTLKGVISCKMSY